MRKFEHGDHDCSVACMDLEDALQTGLLRGKDGKPHSFQAFATGRAAYAFCSGCGHFSWSASEIMAGVEDESDIKADSLLETGAINGFRGAADESCEAERNLLVIREVLTS